MLTELTIKNFALIEDLTLEFLPGLSVFTGETGAGKSIVLEAIRFLFGENPGSADMLRKDAPKLEVSGTIRLPKNSPEITSLLKELDIEPKDHTILLRRSYDAATGRTRAWIEDVTVSVSIIQKISSCLLEIHSQGSVSDLRNPDFPLTLLDQYGTLGAQQAAWAKSYEELREASNAWQVHQQFIQENTSRLDFLKFQMEELSSVALDTATQSKIETELPLWMSREKITQELQATQSLLCGEERDIASQISQAQNHLAKVQELLPSNNQLSAAGKSLKDAQVFLEEAQESLRSITDSLEFDPQQLEELLTTKAKIEKLLKKYRLPSATELKALQEKIAQDLSMLENSEIDDKNLKKQLDLKQTAAVKSAKALSEARKKQAQLLDKELTKEIRALGLDKAQIEIKVETDLSKLGPSGADQVLMLFAPNPGEGSKELALIASGGEASRVALAIHILLANLGHREGTSPWRSHREILIFDEIEQGLSAKITTLVAKKLQALSKTRQILLITHSPVLAALGDNHFASQKHTQNGRTKTLISRINNKEDKKSEILRLLGAVSAAEKNTLKPYVEELISS